MGLTAGDELGGENVAVADELAIDAAFIVKDVELVAGADVVDEVDVPLEHLAQAQRERVAQA